MTIIGYSERGAMNALFYGMAFKDDKEAMMKFFDLVGIDADFSDYDFKIYNEFSLSEFGSPDLVILAEKENEKVAFFVEAKASCCKYYDIKEQEAQHNDYVSKGEHDDGHASNLFFQLRLKNYFYQKFCERKNSDSVIINNDVNNRIRKTKGHDRGIGSNPIVQNFVKEFEGCKEVHYIAIIPEQSKAGISNPDSTYEMKIHFITWEKIYEEFKNNDIFKDFQETIKFNQGIDPKIKSEERIKSQILNNPIPDEDFNQTTNP